MPTYEYKCRQCAHQFEVVQSFSAKPLKKCKECGGQLGKVFGSIGIAFKGSGFYRTDSRSGSAATVGGKSDKSENAGKSEKGKSDSGAAAGGDSKKDTTKSAKSDSAPTSKPAKAKESAA